MRSNGSALNRLVLLLGGLVLLVAGVALVTGGVRAAGLLPASLADAAAEGERLLVRAVDTGIGLAAIGGVAALPVAAAVAALVVAVLLLWFVLTRGRSRTREVVQLVGPHGRTTIDRSVADGVLAAPLAARSDVVSARAVARRTGRGTVIGLVVSPRKGAALGAVLAAVDDAVAEWDALLGTPVPLVLHVADRGWREVFASRQRMRRSLAGEGVAESPRSTRSSSTPKAGVA